MPGRRRGPQGLKEKNPFLGTWLTPEMRGCNQLDIAQDTNLSGLIWTRFDLDDLGITRYHEILSHADL